MVGIFYYTREVLNWSSTQNLLLAAGQGVTYIAGALVAGHWARLLGRVRALWAVYIVSGLLALIAGFWPTPAVITIVLLIFPAINAASWPILESLVTSGVGTHQMSRRIGVYNLVWSGVNAISVAGTGWLIAQTHAGLFFVGALATILAGLVLFGSRRLDTIAPTHAHAEPEPALLHQRKLALALSRIGLPATFVVIFSLAAMLPSLPVMQHLETIPRTVVGSVWLLARWGAFAVLGATTAWHCRPRLLLLAAAVMLVAFFGVTLSPSRWFDVSWQFDLAYMMAWQVVLGMAMGLIYSGSLYFGMVLSKGSTEHGGYHEALIGLGSVLGPGSAALMQTINPGNPNIGIATVGVVVGLCVAVSAVTSIRLRSRTPSS